MDVKFFIELGILVLLVALSAFFAGAETALTAASRSRMHALEKDGNARARMVNRLREKKEQLIGALLLCNTLTHVAASALTTALLIRSFGEAGVAYAMVVVSAMMVIFGEVMPKTYAMINADRKSLILAPLVGFVVAVAAPVTIAIEEIIKWFFRLFKVKDVASLDAPEEELRGAIELFKDAMDVDEDQEKGAMLRSVLDLADVKVEEIMVHRKNVHMVNIDLPREKIIDEVLHSAFTRMPVWRESPDNVVGVIHAKLLVQEWRNCKGDPAKINLDNTMLDPWFIPESTTLYDQLQAFRKRREHFAIMVDEYGALKGVITLEDILEEIVGEIDDEHDTAVTGVRPQPDGSYMVDGRVTIRDLNRELDWGLPDEEYSTVAGLLLFESQRIPSVGQTYTFYDFRFEILKKQRNQITVVRIIPPAALGEEVRKVGT